MKNFKRFISIALCLILCMSFCAAAFAEEPASLDTGDMSTDLTAVFITKKLNVAEDIFNNAPHSYQVQFADGVFVTDVAGADTSAPAIANQTITVEYDENDVANGAINFTFLNSVSWVHAGEFDYTVSEVPQTVASPAELDNDTTEFTLRVFVINGASGLQVAGIIVENGGDKVDPSQEEYSETGCGFENTYTESLENEEGVLNVTKTITGTLADKTQEFAITVVLTLPETASAADVAVAEGVDWVADTLTATANLADGDVLSFTKLPAGTKFTVHEDQLAGYKATVSGFVSLAEQDAGASFTTALSDAIIESAEVTITNDLPYTPPTGVVINNLPFILLVVLSVGGLCVYFAASRRRNDEA